MGGLGSDAAIETADVVIQTDQPSRVATAIQDVYKRQVYPTPWIVYRRMQSSPRTGKKETEMCRNNSVFFKISNSEASTKSLSLIHIS